MLCAVEAVTACWVSCYTARCLFCVISDCVCVAVKVFIVMYAAYGVFSSYVCKHGDTPPWSVDMESSSSEFTSSCGTLFAVRLRFEHRPISESRSLSSG